MIRPMTVMQMGVCMDEAESIIRGSLVGRRRAKELCSTDVGVARRFGRFLGLRKTAFLLESRTRFRQGGTKSKPEDGERESHMYRDDRHASCRSSSGRFGYRSCFHDSLLPGCYAWRHDKNVLGCPAHRQIDNRDRNNLLNTCVALVASSRFVRIMTPDAETASARLVQPPSGLSRTESTIEA